MVKRLCGSLIEKVSPFPESFEELTRWWEGGELISSAAKRLIILVPDTELWTKIYTYWTNTLCYPSTAGEGIRHDDYEMILGVLFRSIESKV